MVGQNVSWAPYAGSFGAWSKGRVVGATGTYTGEQAARWAFLQEQSEAKKVAKKARKRGRR